MSKYAICMGVNDYSQWNWPSGGNLNFSEKSAENFAQLLVDAFGFSQDNVSLMRSQWCTKGNILQGIGALLDKAQAGDVVCVFFSGHGSQMQGMAPNGQAETDRFYETILPYSGGHITDREFAVLADRLDFSGVNFTVVLDTCYSGGMHAIEGLNPRGIRLPESLQSVFIESCRTLVPMGLCLENPQSDLAGNVRTIRLEEGRIIIEAEDDSNFVERAKSTVISACRHDEEAWELGAIQNTLLVEAFQKIPDSSNTGISYIDLLQRLRTEADRLMTQHVRTTPKYANDTAVPMIYGQRARLTENFLAPWSFSI